MYTGFFDAASNRATWAFTIDLTADDTDAAIDLTGATVNMAVSLQDARAPLLTGSSTDGKIAIGTPATAGSFAVTFTPTDMAALEGGMYDVGIVVILAGGTTHQVLVATLPVIDGVVA
jgi:hypothetical protein